MTISARYSILLILTLALGRLELHSNVVWPGSNELGMLVGISETEKMDPNGDGTNFSCGFLFPGDHTGRICNGFAWKDGKMTPMPTLGGANSFALNVNNPGVVTGGAIDPETGDEVAFRAVPVPSLGNQ